MFMIPGVLAKIFEPRCLSAHLPDGSVVGHLNAQMAACGFNRHQDSYFSEPCHGWFEACWQAHPEKCKTRENAQLFTERIKSVRPAVSSFDFLACKKTLLTRFSEQLVLKISDLCEKSGGAIPDYTLQMDCVTNRSALPVMHAIQDGACLWDEAFAGVPDFSAVEQLLTIRFQSIPPRKFQFITGTVTESRGIPLNNGEIFPFESVGKLEIRPFQRDGLNSNQISYIIFEISGKVCGEDNNNISCFEEALRELSEEICEMLAVEPPAHLVCNRQ